MVNCYFEVMVTFIAIEHLKGETLILQPTSSFIDFFAATWTMNHRNSIKIGPILHKSLMNLK